MKKNTCKIVYCLSIIFAISAFFMPNLFAEGKIVLLGGTNTVVTINEKTDIDSNDTGIHFEGGENNMLHNTSTGDLNITSAFDGVLFSDENRSEFRNDGATTIDADNYGIYFYEGENNIINNILTGNLDIEASNYGIRFEEVKGSEFRNDGNTIFDVGKYGIYFYEGENNIINNTLTGNLNIRASYRYAIRLWEEEGGSGFNNEGNTTIDDSYGGIHFYKGGKKVILNEATGDLDMNVNRYGINFQEQLGSEFKNYGRTAIDSGFIGISSFNGRDNIINNMSTGILDIKAGMYGIRIGDSSGSKFNNYGNTTIEAASNGIYVVNPGEDKEINNMLTGNLDIRSGNEGMAFDAQFDFEINNHGNTTIEAENFGIHFIHGRDNIINNMSTGSINIGPSVHFAVSFDNMIAGKFNNYGNTTIDASHYGIAFVKGENNIVNNMSTGSINIGPSPFYCIKFENATASEFNNNGNATFDARSAAIYFNNGKNNIVNNMSTGIINIESEERFGIKLENAIDSKFNNDGNIIIDNTSYGIYFESGENNIIHNRSTGSFNIKIDENGVRFGNAIDSSFKNEGNTTIIGASKEGIYFYEGENNIIHNMLTGILDIKGDKNGIKFYNAIGSSFKNEGNTTINLRDSGRDQGINFDYGENNIIHNTPTGSLDITADDYGIKFYNAIGSSFKNEGNTTINNSYYGIHLDHGENNIINNMETGSLDIKARKNGMFFLEQASAGFNNYGSTAIDVESYGIYVEHGDNNIINNGETGSFDIKTNFYGIRFYGAGDSSFKNYGRTTIDVGSHGIRFDSYSGEDNNIINNGETGILNIASNKAGIYAEGGGSEHIINNGYLFIINSESNESINLGGGDDYFTNAGILDLSGDISGGEGEDTFTWEGAGTNTFNQDIISFETIDKNDEGTWNLEGKILESKRININKGKFNFQDTLKIDGDLNLYGSLVIDVSDAAVDFINIDGKANIDSGKLIIRTPANLDLSKDWMQTILEAGTIEGEFVSYSDDSSDYDFLVDYNDNNITLRFIIAPDEIGDRIINSAAHASLSLSDVAHYILLGMSQTPGIIASPFNFYIPFDQGNSKLWSLIVDKNYNRNMNQHIETIGFDTHIFDNFLIGAAYSNGDITTDGINTEKSVYSLYGKLRYGGFNFYDVISLDRNKGLVSVDNISNYLGADYIIDLGIFKFIPKMGLLTIYNSDSHIVSADAGVEFRADITDYLKLTNEIRFSDVITSKETSKDFFNNLITIETGLYFRYKKITLGLIYSFLSGGEISSDWIGFNFVYHF